MTEEAKTQKTVSRRGFLKTTAAVGAVAALGAAVPGASALAAGAKTANDGERSFAGVCRGNCFQGCAVDFHVRDGQITRVSARDFPETAYNRICPKGLSLSQRVYNKDRLKYPMKRVGERGSDQWERISWDEALDTIADTWKSIKQQYGKNCIAHQSTAGNTGMSIGNMSNLFSLLGAVSICADIDTALFKGTLDTVGYNAGTNSSNDLQDIVNSKTIVLWACNMTETQIQMWHSLADAKENGAKIICIDPNFTASAGKADYYVPLRPGTDAALAMGMMNIVLANGWEDIDYLKRATVAPLLVKQDGTYLRNTDIDPEAAAAVQAALAAAIAKGGPRAAAAVSKGNLLVWDPAANTYGVAGEVADPAIEGEFEVEGIPVRPAYALLLERIAPYTPERVSEICDVPVSLMEQITEVYTKNSPSWIFEGLGFNHYTNGHTAYHALATLAMLTGNLGKSGASCGFIRPGEDYNTGVVSASIVAAAKEAGKYDGPADVSIPANKLLGVMQTGKYVDFDVPLKSMYIYKSNFLGCQTDRKAKLEALNGMDLIVVADMYMTDTARYADIVLPVPDFPEVLDVHNRTVYPYTLLQEKAIDPLYESKTDFEIANALAERMGLGEFFARTHEEYLQECMGEKWEELFQNKAIRMSYYDGHYIHGEGDVFPTATKRAQFYFETPMQHLGGDTHWGEEVDMAKERMVYWEPPSEAWHENEIAKKYPMSVWQEHVKWRTHTQFGYVPWLRELDPEPVVKMSEEDAAARNIATGDIVKVFNDRGYCVLKAVVNPGCRPGMVNIPHGWQENQFIEGHYCDLLSPAMAPINANQCFNDCMVEIEKYEEA